MVFIVSVCSQVNVSEIEASKKGRVLTGEGAYWVVYGIFLLDDGVMEEYVFEIKCGK